MPVEEDYKDEKEQSDDSARTTKKPAKQKTTLSSLKTTFASSVRGKSSGARTSRRVSKKKNSLMRKALSRTTATATVSEAKYQGTSYNDDDFITEFVPSNDWVASVSDISDLIEWVAKNAELFSVDDEKVEVEGDAYGDEYNAMLSAFVAQKYPGKEVKKDAADVAWHRIRWSAWRKSGRDFMKTLSLLDCVHRDRRFYWNRVVNELLRTGRSLEEVGADIMALMDAGLLDIPHLFLKFSHNPNAAETYAYRVIVFHENNGSAMRLQIGGNTLTAYDYFSRVGATELVKLFAETGAECGSAPSGEVLAFAQRHTEDKYKIADSFKHMSATEKVACVRDVRRKWTENKGVDNKQYQTALLKEPSLWKEFVHLVKIGVVSPSVALSTVYSSKNPIVDQRITDNLVHFFGEQRTEKARELQQTIYDLCDSSEEPSAMRKAYADIVAMDDVTAEGRPIHDVHLFEGTAAATATAPVPYASEEQIRELALQMYSDSRFPPFLTHDEMFAMRKCMDARSVDFKFREILTELFESDPFLKLGDIYFTKVKGTKRMATKGREYRASDSARFPQSGRIGDKVRATAVFDDPITLLTAITAFGEWLDSRPPFSKVSEGVAVIFLRLKNTFKYLKDRSFGDSKYNMSFVIVKGGVYITALCELQFHLRAVFQSKHESHVIYEILRLERFFREVNKSLLTVELISSQSQIDELTTFVTLSDYFDCYVPAADRCKAVANLLKVHDLDQAHAEEILSLTSENPFAIGGVQNGNGISEFIEAHAKKELMKWLEIVDALCADFNWRLLKNSVGEIPVLTFLRVGEWNEELIGALMPDCTLRVKYATDDNGANPAHYAGRRAARIGKPAIDALHRCFRGASAFLRKSGNNGPPVVDYLNAGGLEESVARLLIPKTLDPRKELVDVLLTVDFKHDSLAKIHILRSVFSADQLECFKGAAVLSLGRPMFPLDWYKQRSGAWEPRPELELFLQ